MTTTLPHKCMSFGAVEECLRIKFEPDVVRAIYQWLKKRKASRSAYILDEDRS